MADRKYYEAYDDRYKQVHEKNLRWFSDVPSAIVGEVMSELHISADAKILEIGCGEGRDANYLLNQGYSVLATDISTEAIACCKADHVEFAERFQVLDCVHGQLEGQFDFIYAVAVVHMLVDDEDRDGFYRFIRNHLTEDGAALICTMGNGTVERSSDSRTAFELQERQHEASGEKLLLAGTSCRVVSFETFLNELRRNALSVCKYGNTCVEPDFPVMMYAVVKRES